MDFLAQNGESPSDGKYLFEQDGDITSLQFKRRDEVCDDFHLISVAEIESIFLPSNLPHYEHQHLGWLNSHSVFGAYFLQDGKIHLKAQFSIYEEEPASEFIANLIINVYGRQQSIGSYEAKSKVDHDFLIKSRSFFNGAHKWENQVSDDEYNEVANIFTNRGLLASGGKGGFVLEIPLSGDSPSASVDPKAQTALLKVTTSVPHPIAGMGYLSTIALPITPRKNKINDIANSLNLLEFNQDDFVPRLGSWGVRVLGTDLVYSYFIPTGDRYGDFHEIIMNWNIQRLLWIKDNFWDPEKGISLPTNSAGL